MCVISGKVNAEGKRLTSEKKISSKTPPVIPILQQNEKDQTNPAVVSCIAIVEAGWEVSSARVLRKHLR